MKKFILGSITILMLLLTGCSILNPPKDNQEPSKEASVEGLQAYMKLVFDRDVSEVTLLEQKLIKAHEEYIVYIDGGGIKGKVGDNTETCYLAYSPDDDLYFLVIHSSLHKRYDSSYKTQMYKINHFDEAINFCKDKMGENFVRYDVDLYYADDLQFSDNPHPIYDDRLPDAREAYNRFMKELTEPFDVIFKTEDASLEITSCLNIYETKRQPGEKRFEREDEEALHEIIYYKHIRFISVRDDES